MLVQRCSLQSRDGVHAWLHNQQSEDPYKVSSIDLTAHDGSLLAITMDFSASFGDRCRALPAARGRDWQQPEGCGGSAKFVQRQALAINAEVIGCICKIDFTCLHFSCQRRSQGFVTVA